MMDVIQTAKELGKTIQADDRYIKMTLAQQKADEDAELQALILEFNQKRAELNMEISKVERDADKVSALDAELKSVYEKVFHNENMKAVTQTRTDLEALLTHINQIVSGSAQGRDPETIEYQASCGGECGGCSGCN